MHAKHGLNELAVMLGALFAARSFVGVSLHLSARISSLLFLPHELVKLGCGTPFTAHASTGPVLAESTSIFVHTYPF
jgi:hypothetical protein